MSEILNRKSQNFFRCSKKEKRKKEKEERTKTLAFNDLTLLKKVVSKAIESFNVVLETQYN
jgi:hypothetical protein